MAPLPEHHRQDKCNTIYFRLGGIFYDEKKKDYRRWRR
ncbi:hypothetical protein Psch_00400 [Pelotomaculum schinkii]|uniref:Uncharacterized protein n=1 Tax=Pelotomaculum schinkii TaxID=78350 RepID=A0A4Y7REX2_9FIRM|nr:hypothetical protein Psch_00400 [Pelotomaculum schinkii]TEB15670.1 hypothetical protein Psfp_01901 [Pelotomaculum sp. FP]